MSAKFDRNFHKYYEQTLCLHQLSTVSNAQELGHIEFVFFRTQLSPTKHNQTK